VSASYFTSPWTRLALEATKEHGFPWRFGTDDPEGLFARHGWSAQVRQPGEPGAAYGRWTLPVLPRDQLEAPHSFLVVARKG
jgi:hypothetical protein